MSCIKIDKSLVVAYLVTLCNDCHNNNVYIWPENKITQQQRLNILPLPW